MIVCLSLRRRPSEVGVKIRDIWTRHSEIEEERDQVSHRIGEHKGKE